MPEYSAKSWQSAIGGISVSKIQKDLRVFRVELSEDIHQMKKNIAFRNLFLDDNGIVQELKYVLGNILQIVDWTITRWIVGNVLAFLSRNGGGIK